MALTQVPSKMLSPDLQETTFGFKNRIINGAMMIDQRATAVITGGYSVDRWRYADSGIIGKATAAQSTQAPTGFVNSLGVTSSSSYSVGAGELFIIQQRIEGSSISDFAWGTANAATVTLSFWVRSSLTGTFGGSLKNNAADRSYPFSYTISSTNTWEQKSIVVTGDTTGTWLTTNGVGIQLSFSLGAGSTYSGTAGAWASGNYNTATGATSVVGTNGATFYITGVQLEKGSTATSFDYRPYGTELQLCQRYTRTMTNGSENAGHGFCNGSAWFYSFDHGVPMRASPSVSWSGTINPSNYSSNFSTVTGVGNVSWQENSGTMKIGFTLNSSPAAQNGGINPNGNKILLVSEL